MDNDPRPRKGKYGNKKDQKQKAHSDQLGSGRGTRVKLANIERAVEKKQENNVSKKNK